MFNKLTEKFANSVSQAIIKDTKSILEDHKNELHMRFNELDGQFRILFQKINELEKRLETKEINDKQKYGELHYRLESMRKDQTN